MSHCPRCTGEYVATKTIRTVDTCPGFDLEARIAELEGENAKLKVKALPSRQHSDESWRRRVAELEAELRANVAGVQEAKYERERTERVVNTNLELEAHLAAVVGAARRVISVKRDDTLPRCLLMARIEWLADALSSPPIAAIVERREAWARLLPLCQERRELHRLAGDPEDCSCEFCQAIDALATLEK